MSKELLSLFEHLFMLFLCHKYDFISLMMLCPCRFLTPFRHRCIFLSAVKLQLIDFLLLALRFILIINTQMHLNFAILDYFIVYGPWKFVSIWKLVANWHVFDDVPERYDLLIIWKRLFCVANKFGKSTYAILMGLCFQGECGVKVKPNILWDFRWNCIFIILFLIVIILFRIFLTGSNRFILCKNFDELLVSIGFFRIPSAHKS